MGPPPKYLIDRKLIRSISKKVVPKNPLIPQQYFSGLLNCWKNHGVGSSKCMQEQQKYDFAQSETQKFREKLKNMNIKQIVSSQLQTPVYHYLLKGRHTAERLHNKYRIDLEQSIF